MKNEQQSWQRVTKLFDEALEHAPEDRSRCIRLNQNGIRSRDATDEP
jgi:hypothetical protein